MTLPEVSVEDLDQMAIDAAIARCGFQHSHVEYKFKIPDKRRIMAVMYKDGFMAAMSVATAHLLIQDAEIERLQSGLAKHVNRVCDLQSSLAAADALLRDIKNWDVDAAQGTCLMVPHSLRSRIQAHLQGAGNEH